MKALYLMFILTIVSMTASAGDGGFLLYTCVSDSGRTNLTIYQDNLSVANVPIKVVFGIDGQFITYAPEVGKCQVPSGALTEEDCLFIDADANVVVRQGDTTLMAINFGDSLSASIEGGFYDPRPDYAGVSTGRINLTCKEYYQSP